MVNSTRESVTIVVPCFNEADRLDESTFLDYASYNTNVRFLFVNDGSTDATASVIQNLCDASPCSFALLDLERNCGKAEAVRQGMQQAMTTGADFVGFWDADLATPLEAITNFCEVLQRHPEVQIVVGTRIPLLGHHVQRTPVRGILGSLFARVASLSLGFRACDTQCGAKIFRRTPVTEWLFERRFVSRWIFDVELLGRFAFAQKLWNLPRIESMLYELPLDEWRDVTGSKLKGRDFIQAIAELLVIHLRNRRLATTSLAALRRKQLLQTQSDALHAPLILRLDPASRAAKSNLAPQTEVGEPLDKSA